MSITSFSSKIKPLFLSEFYKKNHKKLAVGTTLCYLLVLSSCGNAKNAVYFDENSSSAFIGNVNSLEPVIQKNDLLSIAVSSASLEAADLFNQQNDAAIRLSGNSGPLSQVTGYLVDQDGFVNFPVLGNIQVAGRTKKDVRDEITAMLIGKKLLIEPIVDIRYLNYKVTILGEVKNPSSLTIPNEKVSLLEALGLVGDITIYGRRDNITLIRDEDGVKRIRKIDLTTNEIFNSPYYYLKSNDIVYVQPNKGRIASASESKTWIPVILSTISLAVITIVTINNRPQ